MLWNWNPPHAKDVGDGLAGRGKGHCVLKYQRLHLRVGFPPERQLRVNFLSLNIKASRFNNCDWRDIWDFPRSCHGPIWNLHHQQSHHLGAELRVEADHHRPAAVKLDPNRSECLWQLCHHRSPPKLWQRTLQANHGGLGWLLPVTFCLKILDQCDWKMCWKGWFGRHQSLLEENEATRSHQVYA